MNQQFSSFAFSHFEPCRDQGSSNLTGDAVRSPTDLMRRADEYREVLVAQERSALHVTTVHRHIREVLTFCGGELSRSGVERALGTVLAKGRSLRTANGYLTSVRAFCRWAADEDNGYLPHDPTRSIKKFRESKDPRRIRRALTEPEIGDLLAAAAADGKRRCGLTGQDWAERWHALLATALRISTLRQLSVGQFRLADPDNPHLVVYGWQEKKHGIDRLIPLLPDSADRIRGYLSGKMPAALAFPLPAWNKSTLTVFRVHLRGAGIEPFELVAAGRDGRKRRKINVVDVHALRTTRGTQMERAGIPVKIAQLIMGHADAATTQKFYQRVTQGDLSTALKRLAPLNPAARVG